MKTASEGCCKKYKMLAQQLTHRHYESSSIKATQAELLLSFEFKGMKNAAIQLGVVCTRVHWKERLNVLEW